MEQDLVRIINSSERLRLRQDIGLWVGNLIGGSNTRKDSIHRAETKNYMISVFTFYSDGEIQFQNLFATPKNSYGKPVVYTYTPKEGDGALFIGNDDSPEIVQPDVAVSRLASYGVYPIS
ncbi:hypothetical protein HYW20_06110 [Candidatus Woesearchaeota archaeon]|nr:hypothetical protein [Candidatus Woesearchaeota archaeon]